MGFWDFLNRFGARSEPENIQYRKNAVVDGLKANGNWTGISAAINELKKPGDRGGWDWNPFNRDDDEYGVIGEITNNIRLGINVMVQTVYGVESLASQGQMLQSSEEKLDGAAEIVSNVVKAVLPGTMFLLKPVVKPVVSMVITFLVGLANKRLGHDWLKVGGPDKLLDELPV